MKLKYLLLAAIALPVNAYTKQTLTTKQKLSTAAMIVTSSVQSAVGLTIAGWGLKHLKNDIKYKNYYVSTIATELILSSVGIHLGYLGAKNAFEGIQQLKDNKVINSDKATQKQLEFKKIFNTKNKVQKLKAIALGVASLSGLGLTSFLIPLIHERIQKPITSKNYSKIALPLTLAAAGLYSSHNCLKNSYDILKNL